MAKTPAGKGGPPAKGGGGDGAGGALGGTASAVAGALGALATQVAQLDQTFQGLVSTVAPFVQAVSPSTMQEFNSVVKDLQATLGVAFVGFVQVLSSFGREVGGVLLPLMQKLKPVFDSLGNVVGNAFLSAVIAVTAVFEALAPVLEIVVALFNLLSKVLLDLASVLAAGIKVLGALFASLFGDGSKDAFKDALKGIVDAIRAIIRNLLSFAAVVATVLGFAETVTQFAAAIDKEAKDREARAGGQKAAANNPSFQALPDIVRQFQQNAFIATGTGATREKPEVEFLRQLSTDLKTIANNRRTVIDTLNEWFNGIIGPGTPVGKALGAISDIYNWLLMVPQKIKGWLGF